MPRPRNCAPICERGTWDSSGGGDRSFPKLLLDRLYRSPTSRVTRGTLSALRNSLRFALLVHAHANGIDREDVDISESLRDDRSRLQEIYGIAEARNKLSVSCP